MLPGFTYTIFVNGDWVKGKVHSNGDKFALMDYQNAKLGKQRLTLADDSYFVKGLDIEWYLQDIQRVKQTRSQANEIALAKAKYEFEAMVTDDMETFENWMKH